MTAQAPGAAQADERPAAPGLTVLVARAQQGDSAATNSLSRRAHGELRRFSDRCRSAERPGAIS